MLHPVLGGNGLRIEICIDKENRESILYVNSVVLVVLGEMWINELNNNNLNMFLLMFFEEM